MDSVELSKVAVSPIHDVEAAGLDGNVLEHRAVENAARSNNNKGGDIPAQIEERV